MGITENSARMFCSFLLGAMFVFTFAFQDKKDVMEFEKIKEMIYADISFDIIDDINHPDHPEIIESLCISKDGYPFIILYKDSSNKIIRWAITDGKEGMIALSKFDEDRISEFVILGNKVHENLRMPVFSFKASGKAGVWNEVIYMPTARAIKENGKPKSYAAIGEVYDDIDFDGQFDAKRVLNKESEIVYEYIFVDGKWLALDNRGSDERIKKIGHYSTDRLDAVTFDGKEKVYYDFEIGKGWKKRTQMRESQS